jgi:phospholipid/cholesterol/gamma-HCH transport system ATP-binding protein
MPDPIVSLRGITAGFGPQIILQDLDLDIRRGEVLGLIGGSGTGKSVLLRTITGLLRPRSGEITIMGINLAFGDEKQWNKARRHWGILFQDGALFSSLTVLENTQVPLKQFAKLSPEMLDQVARLKIAMVGLPPEAAAKYPRELSGGMRKRAGLARALVMDPAILLLDEPTAGLDPIGAAAFDDLIRTLSRALGLTVCMITHDIDSLYAVCDQVAVLAEKRIYAQGTIDELLHIDHPWIQDYFKGPRGRAAKKAGRSQLI